MSYGSQATPFGIIGFTDATSQKTADLTAKAVLRDWNRRLAASPKKRFPVHPMPVRLADGSRANMWWGTFTAPIPQGGWPTWSSVSTVSYRAGDRYVTMVSYVPDMGSGDTETYQKTFENKIIPRLRPVR